MLVKIVDILNWVTLIRLYITWSNNIFSYIYQKNIKHFWHFSLIINNKGNNKITEHWAIFQRERQHSLINNQTKSVNNTKTGKTGMALTWYRHFPQKMVGWIRFYGAKPPASIMDKRFRCHYNSIFNNTGTK